MQLALTVVWFLIFSFLLTSKLHFCMSSLHMSDTQDFEIRLYALSFLIEMKELSDLEVDANLQC